MPKYLVVRTLVLSSGNYLNKIRAKALTTEQQKIIKKLEFFVRFASFL